MSNVKSEIMNTLKKILGFYEEKKVEDFKVYSDSEIKISDKAVGGKVELVDADGNLSDAPDGDYEMDNGFKFTVKGGVIASIEGEEKPKEDAPVEADATDTPVEDAPAEDSKYAELEARVTALEQAVADMNSSVQAAATKEDLGAFTKEVETLNSNIQLLAKVPVEFSQTTKNNTVKESKEDKLLALAKMIGSKN